MRARTYLLIGIVALAGCVRNNPPAPVVYGPTIPSPPPVQEARRTPPAEVPVARPAPSPTLPQARVAPAPVELHKVRPGETIYGIARKYGVDARELVRLNAIPPPYRIQAGRVLKMPPRLPSQFASNAASASRPMRRSTTSVAVSLPPPKPRATPSPAFKLPDELPDPESNQPSLAAPVPTKTPARAGRGFLWPVKGKVLERFGMQGDGLHNDGINIAAPRGAPIRAAENGVVVYAGNELSGFGNLLILRHADGWMTAYGHIDAMRVRRGDTVRRGQVIATVGQTGGVGTPQLHFELRRGSTPVDPTRYLAGSGTAGLNSPNASRGGRPSPG